jgi:hypothetical protein
MSQGATAATIDAREFARFIASFDNNPSEAEAMNAARMFRRMVKKDGLRFVDVMEWPEVKAALDEQMQPMRHEAAELVALRERLKRMTALDGVVKEREETIAGLRREIAALAVRNKPCHPCEIKRRLMAGGAGVMIAAACFYLLPSSGGDAGWETGGAIALALAPLAVVFCRWHWLIFRRPGGLAVRWNGLVQRMVQRLEAMAARMILEVRE